MAFVSIADVEGDGRYILVTIFLLTPAVDGMSLTISRSADGGERDVTPTMTGLNPLEFCGIDDVVGGTAEFPNWLELRGGTDR